MINILNPFSIFKKEDKKTKKSSSTDKKEETKSFLDKFDNFTSFIKVKIKEGIKESYAIKERFKNLKKSNYDLGMWHLENYKLNDAILRFKIMNLFWPNYDDGRYQLAYCLALMKKDEKAISLLSSILVRNADFNKARQLKDKIQSGKFNKDIEEFEEKLKKKRAKKIENKDLEDLAEGIVKNEKTSKE